jgi:hypothetical protein
MLNSCATTFFATPTILSLTSWAKLHLGPPKPVLHVQRFLLDPAERAQVPWPQQEAASPTVQGLLSRAAGQVSLASAS